MNNNQYPKETNSKNNSAKKYRKRKKIWYNPPYTKHSNINIPKIFFYALDKCFHIGHRYNKIFNRHTIKLSYSTAPNIADIIAGLNHRKINNYNTINHDNNSSKNIDISVNKQTKNSRLINNIIVDNVMKTATNKIMNNNDNNNKANINNVSNIPNDKPNNIKNKDRTCNCRISSECPVNNKCLTKDVVYMAEVYCYNDKNDIHKVYKYVGATSNSFKNRYTNHKHSFKHQKLKFTTSLSSLVHELKDRGKHYDIIWSLIKNAKSYRLGNKICDLCIA